jgi:hypothetical protein
MKIRLFTVTIIILFLSCSNIKNEQKWFRIGFEQGCEAIVNDTHLKYFKCIKLRLRNELLSDWISEISHSSNIMREESVKMKNQKRFAEIKNSRDFGAYLSYLLYAELQSLVSKDQNKLDANWTTMRWLDSVKIEDHEFKRSALKEIDSLEHKIERFQKEFVNQLRQNIDSYENIGWKLYLSERAQLLKKRDFERNEWYSRDEGFIKTKWGIEIYKGNKTNPKDTLRNS